MKACGIIAEYNPFHKGHIYQIEETKKKTGCDVMIAVMSGHFTQRGEPAVIDKWSRAEYAVRGGIDLVLELPYIHAVQSASHFARGGVSVLKKAGISYLSFGSECGNLENLKEIAETPVNPDHLHQSLSSGMSFPKAYSLLTGEMLPNDILAVCYLKELMDTDIEPVLIPRTSSYNDDEIREVSSALAIRTALKKGLDLSDSTPMKDILTGSFHPWMELYYPYLRTFLLMTDKERLSSFFLFSEGIENHLIEKAERNDTWDSFLKDAVTYRYTASRIRRTCLQALNQITKEEVSRLPEHDAVRVLAFNDTGRAYLREMKESQTKFACRFADIPRPWRLMEYKTTMLYSSVFPEEERKHLLHEEVTGARFVSVNQDN